MRTRGALERAATESGGIADTQLGGISAVVDAVLDELIQRVPSWQGQRVDADVVEDWLRAVKNGMA